MITLGLIETDIREALKQRNQLAADTLRALKTRVQNDQIAHGTAELGEEEILTLIRSEVKRRKEAVDAYASGGRTELAEKEQAEIDILQQYLPAQMSEEEIAAKIDELVAVNSWTTKDFGPAMGKLKGELGNNADGAVISRILKEKLS